MITIKTTRCFIIHLKSNHYSMKINRFTKQLSLLLVFSLICMGTFAQVKMITGKVSDSAGAPMIGVTVAIQGTTTGTITDVDGNYSLQAQKENKLQFSFIVSTHNLSKLEPNNN
jgi:hypothetical protein